jgi:hypothetical protein
VEAVERALRSVLVRLEPADHRTDAYLAGRERSGFSAFPDLSPSTRRRLEQLPPWIGDPALFSGRAEDLRILDLSGAEAETVRDWHGWSPAQAFRRVLEISGVKPAGVGAPVNGPESRAAFTLGRVFWNALIRGGVQAGVYVIDSLCAPAGKPKYIVRNWLA